MRYISLLAVAFVLAACQSSQAERGQSGARASQEGLIDALVSARDLHTAYVEDAASDASATERPVPEVKNILNLGADAIPLLIEHLDDGRLTAATFNTSQGQGKPRLTGRATVGYVCLDILMSVVDGPPVWIEGCGDDGLGACVEPGFYFRPDEAAGSVVAGSKTEWQKAYRDGKLKFRTPKSVAAN
jgi:hypothetical protein